MVFILILTFLRWQRWGMSWYEGDEGLLICACVSDENVQELAGELVELGLISEVGV